MNTISGYAAHFLNIDDVSDIIMPNAINLSEFLKSGFVAGIDHDWDNQIDITAKVNIDEKGLFIELQLNDTYKAKEVFELVKNRKLGYFSIGYRTLEKTHLFYKDIYKIWEKNCYKPTDIEFKNVKQFPESEIRILNKIELLEISPVYNPANKKCAITSFSENGFITLV